MMEFPFCRQTHSRGYSLLSRIAHLLDFDNGPWVAGGSIRRIITREESEAFDIDVFFTGDEQRMLIGPQMRKIEREMHAEMFPDDLDGLQNAFCVPHAAIQGPAPQMQRSDNAGLAFQRSSIFPPLQFVTSHYYQDCEALVKDIDFTICQMVTDGKMIRCPHRSLNDLSEKRLRISSSTVVRHNTRIFRYFTYGFEPDESVMSIVENIPGGSYYDPEAGGFTAYKPIVDAMLGDDLSEQITIGKLADVMIERTNGKGTAYLHGYPFPAPLAYLFITCESMRDEIAKLLLPLWDSQKLTIAQYSVIGSVAPKRFFQAYRQAFREE